MEHVWLFAGLAILLIQAGVITWLYLRLHNTKRSSTEIIGRIIDAGEADRKQISHQLHDDIGQRLSLALIQLDMFRNQVPPASPIDQSELRAAMQEISTLVTDLHNITHVLYSSKLAHLGLKSALKEVCDRVSREQHAQVDLDFSSPNSIPEHVALSLYRVAQEALTNGVTQNYARPVKIFLSETPGEFLMRIACLDPQIDSYRNSPKQGIGSLIMRERVKSIGGTFSVRDTGKGMEIVVTAPKPNPLAPKD